MPIRTLVVDDMLLARNRVKRHIEDDPDIEIIGEASGGQAAIDAVRALTPDLVFLDVQMPEIGGFEVLEAIGAEAMPVVIFVTAYDQFALRAFDVHALDYLLKPFDADRMAHAVARAKRAIAGRTPGTAAEKLRALVDDIDYIEAAGNYLRIQAGAESHMIRDKISDMEQRLDPRGFARIHRSTIVNIERIKEMHPLFNGDQTVVLKGGKRLTMSRTYREGVMKLLDRL